MRGGLVANLLLAVGLLFAPHAHPIILSGGQPQAAVCAGPNGNSCVAVAATSANNTLCNTLTGYYYEFGNSTTALLSGTGGRHYCATAGNGSVTCSSGTGTASTCTGSGIGSSGNGCPASVDVNSRTQAVVYASGSKWIYGMYVSQTQQVSSGGPASVPSIQQPYMNFTSGYVGMTNGGTACNGSTSPIACLALNPAFSALTPGEAGHFHYDAGHFENHASTYGILGNKLIYPTTGAPALGANLRNGLGLSGSITYTNAILAGGLYGPISDYVTLLQMIMTGTLSLGLDLKYNATCMENGASYTVDAAGNSVTPFTCGAVAGGSPYSPYKYYYSFGHVIEQDPTVHGDGAFSSAGSYGIYPALAADKSFYEVLSRRAQPGYYGLGQQGIASLKCGVLLRAAWNTGVEQTGSNPF